MSMRVTREGYRSPAPATHHPPMLIGWFSPGHGTWQTGRHGGYTGHGSRISSEWICDVLVLLLACRTSNGSFIPSNGASTRERDRDQQLSALCTLSLPQPGGLTAAQKGRVWVAAALTTTAAHEGWLLCSGYGGERPHSSDTAPSPRTCAVLPTPQQPRQRVKFCACATVQAANAARSLHGGRLTNAVASNVSDMSASVLEDPLSDPD